MSASVARVPGVISADLNFASGTLLVEYEAGSEPLGAVVRTVEASGHGVQSLDEAVAGEPPAERPWLAQNRAEVAAVGSGVFSAMGLIAGLVAAPGWVEVAAYAIAIGFGGFLVWQRALVSLRARMLDMNVLMSTAVFGAAALGEWGEGATVFFLFAVGGLLESRSLERTRRSIRGLMELSPPTARVLRGGEFVEVALEAVERGETVIVRPGERIAVDGVVSTGSSAVDESAITGESVPAEKDAGDRVFAGTLNTTGLLEVRATASGSDSTLSRIVYLVEEAQAARAPAQTLVERFSRYYTPAVIGLAVLIVTVPPLALPLLGTDAGPWSDWVRRALVMLVVSCPCALVISTPVSIVSAITRASRDGVLVKGGAFLEAAAKVKAVAFDKTGTLTRGLPEVRSVVPLGGRSRQEVLAVAAGLESHSNHPLARSIVRAASGLTLAGPVERYEELPGSGVRGHIGDRRWEVCSPLCAEEAGAHEAVEAAKRIEERGETALVLLSDGEAVAVLGVADVVREEASRAVAALRRGGVEHLVMLTGDNERVGESIAAEVGLDGFLARLLPVAKTDAVRVLKQRYATVAMVGDGVNDAPALAVADIGIAMGAAGTDTALETADVALMRDDLTALAGFFDLGRRTMRTIIQNVAFSLLIKAAVLILAMAGQATLWMAVFADTGVSLIVIANGMRLLRARRAPVAAE